MYRAGAHAAAHVLRARRVAERAMTVGVVRCDVNNNLADERQVRCGVGVAMGTHATRR